MKTTWNNHEKEVKELQHLQNPREKNSNCKEKKCVYRKKIGLGKWQWEWGDKKLKLSQKIENKK